MTGETDESNEADHRDEGREDRDRTPTARDTSESNSSEVRTDGGEVVTDSSQTTQDTTEPPRTPSPNHPGGRLPLDQDSPTGQASGRDTHQNQPSSSDTPEETTESNGSTNSALDTSDLFAGEIPVDTVIDFYLDTNPWSVQPSTVKSHRYHLGHFQDFCDEQGIENLRNLRPETLDEYQKFLHDHPKLQATATIKGCLASLRKFLKYCERRQVFSQGFHRLIILPTISKYEGQDERWLSRETAREIVDHLETYEPFTREHVVWAILSGTGIRQSTLRAFDLEDYDQSEQYLRAVNREDSGTRLKNGYRAEREISISEDTAFALEGYIKMNRNRVTDDHGREPLLTTTNGRLTTGTMRKYVYAWSRPCAIGKDCPVGEDPNSCKAARTKNDAHACPESVSPHPVRRGYITHLRANGVPTEDVISERCDANPEPSNAGTI